MGIKKKRKYNKPINLEYKYENTLESEQVLEKVFDRIFSDIIQDRKKLIAYYNSDDYKKEYEYLVSKKSILVDFLPIP